MNMDITLGVRFNVCFRVGSNELLVVNLLTRGRARFKHGEVDGSIFYAFFRAHLLHVLFIYHVPLNQIVVHYA